MVDTLPLLRLADLEYVHYLLYIMIYMYTLLHVCSPIYLLHCSLGYPVLMPSSCLDYIYRICQVLCLLMLAQCHVRFTSHTLTVRLVMPHDACSQLALCARAQNDRAVTLRASVCTAGTPVEPWF